MRPLDFLGRIKIKLGIVILLAVVAAFVVNEVGINAGYSRNVRVAVAAVFALILVQLLARGMTKPLREMAAAAQTIAKGRYGLRVTASSRDEVGELARAFNAMAADLGEVDRQRRELVANVSHELRTPITALRAVLENVVDGVSEPDPVTLGTALAQTERLGRLVAQLLDLSRLESGARLIEREDVELRQLCEQALREAVLAREGVVARCEVPEGLSLRADPDLLAQVLANLLDNAVRHSPDGGVVVLAATARGEGVRLRVSDQGPGIAAEDRARAFERFSRLDAGRAADDGGAGLGLAITKEIVELHGGSIHVDDGVGCHVVADLPERIEMNPPSLPAKGAHPVEVDAVTPGKVPPGGASVGTAAGVPSGHREATEVAGGSGGSGSDEPVESGRVSGADQGAGAVEPVERGEPVETGRAPEDRELVGAGQVPRSREVAATASASASGLVTGSTADPVTGPATGSVTGSASGPATGSVTDSVTGPATGPVPGPGGGPAPSSVTASVTGSATSSVAGSVTGPGPGPGGQAGVVQAAGAAQGAGPRETGEGAGASDAATGGPASGAGPGVTSRPVPASPEPGAAVPVTPSPQPYPPRPVLARDGGARQRPVVMRNWPGAVIGVFLGGVGGLVCAAIVGIALASIAPLLGMLAVAAIVTVGAFVGTVIGATTPTDDILAAPSERLPHRPPAQGPVARRVTVPGPEAPHREHREGAASSTAVSRTGGPGEHGDRPGGRGPGTPGGYEAPGGGKGPGAPGGYEAPPIFPRPELPDTPRWVLPVSAAVGALAAVAVPYGRAGLGLVLVAAAMGVATIPAARRRINPWSAGMGAIAYGLVATVMFRDADWLVGVLLLAGFLTAALALSGAGRGWLGVVRGGASVVLGLLPVPWFLGARLKGLASRRRVMPLLLGGGLTVVLLAVFGALFASADAVFAEAVERVFSAQAWAESMPLRILLFVVFAVVVASSVLVALRPVAEPKAPDLRVTVGRGLWVTPLTALNLLFATFVGMQLTVLFGSTRWVLEATGLTYAEYARSGFFQLVVVSVFVLAIVAVASGTLELRGADRWLMAGLLGVLCVLTLVILFSALHRLDLYADAYGLSRLRASVSATVLWLGGIFALVLAAGAARLTGRGHARWLPRTVVIMTSASLLAFAVWNPDLRVAETQIAVRGVERVDLAYLGDLGAEAVPALDRLPEPARSCVLRDVVAANELSGPDPWNGWNLARREARELLDRRPVDRGASCPQTPSRLETPYQD
ncbi:DUF4153 domain-containing protein [Streptosporangium sp. V21-05]|uniref:DUF4153 domain-containing protein n=1 Tax=Streptosporangium sp. V21-05 TaxID=3446115 RepID=UPI003F52C36A